MSPKKDDGIEKFIVKAGEGYTTPNDGAVVEGMFINTFLKHFMQTFLTFYINTLLTSFGLLFHLIDNEHSSLPIKHFFSASPGQIWR